MFGGKHSSLMIKDLAQLLDLDHANELSPLQPVPDSIVTRIAENYPGISKQYLEFIRMVGTGATKQGFYIYEPEPASQIEKYTSYQLNHSAAYRALLGNSPESPDLPADAVMIGDSGASWRYCLCPSIGEAVFCLDMGNAPFEVQYDNFFSFVADLVLLIET